MNVQQKLDFKLQFVTLKTRVPNPSPLVKTFMDPKLDSFINRNINWILDLEFGPIF